LRFKLKVGGAKSKKQLLLGRTAAYIGLKKVGLDIVTISYKHCWALVPAGR
jgi:hypothetical protein